MSERRRAALLALAVGLVALLPFARGLVAGHAFYFRDVSLHFFPIRLFVLEGLGQGELRYWNPYTHEGEPVSLPLGYPGDLLGVVWPTEPGLSLLLALHVPLGALAFFALARELGLSGAGAAAGALVYALGGFALSSLNLYIYAQAMAWAPLVVRGLWRAAHGTARSAAMAAFPLGLALTTTGAEIVAQSVLAGLVLCGPRSRGALLRVVLVLGLGFGLAAFVLLPLSALVVGSARAAGFPTDVVLAQSVHPFTLLQTVVAGLYGDPARLADSFWGQNFFPRGFPYILSLYLGAAALALAALGLLEQKPRGRLVAALAALALVVALGRYAGLGPLVEALDFVRRFRFPSKAFFTVHLGVALLAGLGAHALATAENARPWRRLLGLAGAASFLLLLLAGVVTLESPLRSYLLAGFFPPDMGGPSRLSAARAIGVDCVKSGAPAAALALLALLAARGWLRSSLGALLATGILAADLLRASAGLNPMVSPAFYRLSPAAERMAEDIRSSRGRLFVIAHSSTPAYYAARARLTMDHEAWSFAVLREGFEPHFNLHAKVPTALSLDFTMLVPVDRILRPEDAGPGALPRLIERLRAAAVTRVLALEPLSLPDLALVLEGDPKALRPLVTRLYRLEGSRPRVELLGGGRILALAERPGRLEAQVLAEAETSLVVRDALSPGWTAQVEGRPVPLERYEGRYRAVAVGRGRHVVTFVYRPPGLVAGLVLTMVSGLVVIALVVPRRPRVVSPGARPNA